jgi:AICAR transformylase/IMP cyclohydrolase PurH
MAFVCAASYKNTRDEDSAHRLTKRDRLFPMAAMIRYDNPMSLAVTDAQ